MCECGVCVLCVSVVCGCGVVCVSMCVGRDTIGILRVLVSELGCEQPVRYLWNKVAQCNPQYIHVFKVAQCNPQYIHVFKW